MNVKKFIFIPQIWSHSMNLSSARISSALSTFFSSQPIRVTSYESIFGTYGFISKSGVPSTISMSSINNTPPSILLSLTTDSFEVALII